MLKLGFQFVYFPGPVRFFIPSPAAQAP